MVGATRSRISYALIAALCTALLSACGVVSSGGSQDEPDAEAGPDQIVPLGETVTLAAAADADSFQWRQSAGEPSVELIDEDTATASFAAPNQRTVLTFTLTTTDEFGATADDDVQVTVTAFPEADAGPDQSVRENAGVTLDGSASNDPDGTIDSFQWEQAGGPQVDLNGADTATPSFTSPDLDATATLTFELTVTDDDGATDTDTVAVTVNPNEPPVADAGPNRTVAEGDAVTLDGTASSDPDGTIDSFQWEQAGGPEVDLNGADTATPSFTAPQVDDDTTLTFELTVTDNDGGTDTDTVNITVNDNQPPVADAGDDQTVTAGNPVTLDGSGSSDPDGSVASFRWSGPVALSGADTATPTFTAPPVDSQETLTFTLAATDDDGSTDTDTVAVTVNPAPVNQPPVADAGPNRTVTEGDTVTLNGSASNDPDGSIASFQWSGPVALSGASTPTPSFTAPDVDDGTALTFTLAVTDDAGESDNDTVTVTVNPEQNEAPTADAGDDQTVVAGDNVTLDGSASNDPDGQLDFQWTPASGAGFALDNPNSATPSFTAPDVDDGTALTFTLAVTDDAGESDTDSVTVTVTPAANEPPTATASANPNPADAGQTVTLSGSGDDPDGSIDSFQWTQTGGSSVSLDGADTDTATFTAPSDDSGATLSFQLTVTDEDDASDTDTVTVTVNPPDNEPPNADAGGDQEVEAGDSVTLDGSGSSDPDGDIETFSWSEPDGVTLSDASAAQPTFTAPDVAEATDLSFQLTVTDDDDASDTDTVTVTVNPPDNEPPNADAGGDQEVEVGDTVTLDGSGSSDSDGDIETFSWSEPDGVALSDASAAQPTFTAPDAAEATDLSFQLTVTDDDDASDTDTVTVTVNPPDNEPPNADAGGDQEVEAGDSVTLDGSGSSDPDGDIETFSWSEPDGVALSDASAAQPTFTAPDVAEATDLSFQLTVTDDDDASDTDTVTVTVNPPDNEPPNADAGGDQEVEAGDSVTLDGSGSSDPDGANGQLDFQWAQTGGDPAVDLAGADTDAASFTAPEVQADADLTFQLTVTDEDDASDTDTVTVTINAPENEPPTATASANPNPADAGQTVTLSGSGDDPDGANGQLEFQWAQTGGDPAVDLAGADTDTASFTAPEVQADADLTFQLTVNDEDGETATDTVTVTINAPENEPPTATASANPNPADAGQTVTLDGTGSSDSDGSIDSFQWTQTGGSSVSLDGADTDTATFTAPSDDSGATLSFQLTVTDDAGDSDDATVDVSVNAPPQAGDDTAGNGIGTGSADGDSGGGDEAGGPLFTTQRFNTSPGSANAAAIRTAKRRAQPMTVDVLANDTDPNHDIDPSTVKIDTQPEHGSASVDNDGIVTYTPDPDYEGATDTFTYTVDDGRGATSNVATVTMALEPGALDVAEQCWTLPRRNTLRAALAPDTDDLDAPLRYSLVTRGEQGSARLVDASTGAFTYTAQADARGSDTFAYKVEDADGEVRFGDVAVITDPRLMPLGDGITAGVVDGARALPLPERRVGYRKPLQQRLVEAGYRIDFVGSQSFGNGVTGFDYESEAHLDRSARALAFGAPDRDVDYPDTGIYAWLGRNPADFVLVHVGGDNLGSKGVSEVEAILDEIDRFEADRDTEVRVLLARNIERNPADPRIAAFNDQLEAMARARVDDPDNPAYPDRIVMVDQQAALDYPSDLADHSHPTPAGYEKMAQAWLEAIQSSCRPPASPTP